MAALVLLWGAAEEAQAWEAVATAGGQIGTPCYPIGGCTPGTHGVWGSAAVWDDDNGYAYIFGGCDAPANTLNPFGPPGSAPCDTATTDWAYHHRRDIWRYEPATDTMTVMPTKMLSSLRHHAAVWDPAEEVAYIFGGWGTDPLPVCDTYSAITWVCSGFYQRHIQRYDPNAGTIDLMPTIIPSTPDGGLMGLSAVWDPTEEVAYLFGGYGCNLCHYFDQIWRYDPFLGTIEPVANLPEARALTSAVWDPVDDVAYIFGGYCAASAQANCVFAGVKNTIFRFDPATMSVTTVPATLPTGRLGTSAAWNGDHAYIMGGHTAITGIGSIDSVLRFDPVAGTVAPAAVDLPMASRHTSAVFAGGPCDAVFMFGGRSTGSPQHRQVYEVSTNPACGLVADFSWTAPVCMGQPLTFTDLSVALLTSDISAVSWTFGDGASQGPLPWPGHATHTYASAGTYTVTQSVSNPKGYSDTTSLDVTVVDCSPPVADFEWNDVCAGTAMAFTDLSAPASPSASPIIEVTWDFGDGTVQGPLPWPGHTFHTFQSPGVHTVHLTVENAMGASATSIQNVLVCAAAEPEPDLHPPLVLNLTAEADGLHRILLAWETEEGTAPIASIEVHAGSAPAAGTLLATLPGGALSHADEGLKPGTQYCYVVVAHSQDGLTGISGQACASTATPLTAAFNLDLWGRELRLMDTSTPGLHPIAAWRWQFGDGGFSDDQHPVHRYREGGHYTIRLTVTDVSGASDSAQATVFMPRVDAPLAGHDPPRLRVHPEEQTVQSGATVLLAAKTEAGDGAVHVQWRQVEGPPVGGLLGADSHNVVFVASPDLAGQEVIFEAVAYDGIMHSEPQRASVRVEPASVPLHAVVVDAQRTVRAGERVELRGAVEGADPGAASYSWKIMDGPEVDLDGADRDVVAFTAPGTATELLIRFSVAADGRTADADARVRVVADDGVTAAFTLDFSQVHEGRVRFEDLSQGVVAHRVWSVGDDGTRQHLASFDHVFDSPGPHTVHLWVSGTDGTMDQLSRTFTIEAREVAAVPEPVRLAGEDAEVHDEASEGAAPLASLAGAAGLVAGAVLLAVVVLAVVVLGRRR